MKALFTINLFLFVLLPLRLVAGDGFDDKNCKSSLSFDMGSVLNYHVANNYRVTRNVFEYINMFRFFSLGPLFDSLTGEDAYLDLGIGEGIVLHEILNKRTWSGQAVPQLFGVTYEAGLSDEFKQLVAESDRPGSKLRLFVGSLFHEIVGGLPRRGLRLITDAGGVMAYTDDLSRDLYLALNLLVPPRQGRLGGEMRMVIHKELLEVETREGQLVDTWENFFMKIKGAKVYREITSIDGDEIWAIRIVQDSPNIHISVPKSHLVKYELRTGLTVEQEKAGETLDKSIYGNSKPAFRRLQLF